jgi:hypothetical protein
MIKLSLEPTDRIVEVNGIPCRIWQGTTDAGVPVHCYITRIAVPTNKPDECERFAAELKESAAPRPEVQAIPLRLLL